MLDTDANGLLEERESLYQQLANLSAKQLQLAENQLQDEKFAELFGKLALQWNEIQLAIEYVEDRLNSELDNDVIASHFRSRIAPIAAQAKDCIDRAESLMRGGISDTGNHIRAAREHRIARHAYGSDSDHHESLFFDERK